MKKLFLSLTIVLSAITQTVQAQEEPKAWTHESELGIVTTSGNSETESYSGKQTTVRNWGPDSLTFSARYLQTKAESVVTAKSWDTGLRYGKNLGELWGLFIAHKAEADRFAGFIQRDTSDLGVKYNIKKTEDLLWLAEAGYSYIKTYENTRINKYDPSYRIYTEVSKKLESNLSFKYWLEYLQSFTHSKTYFVNTEASLNIILSNRFSLKTGYLLKYKNDRPLGVTDYSDSTFTTALVAKF